MPATLLLAVALMLILEGLLPFLSPKLWRLGFRRMTELNDGQLRFLGLSSILVGVMLLMVFR